MHYVPSTNGVSDDTAAIQYALHCFGYAALEPGLPYRTTGPVTVCSGQRIFGNGAKITCETPHGNAIRLAGHNGYASDSLCADVLVKDLTVESIAEGSIIHDARTVFWSDHCHLSRIVFGNVTVRAPNTWLNGFHFGTYSGAPHGLTFNDILWHGCTVEKVGRVGIEINNSFDTGFRINNVRVTDCHIRKVGLHHEQGMGVSWGGRGYRRVVANNTLQEIPLIAIEEIYGDHSLIAGNALQTSGQAFLVHGYDRDNIPCCRIAVTGNVGVASKGLLMRHVNESAVVGNAISCGTPPVFDVHSSTVLSANRW